MLLVSPSFADKSIIISQFCPGAFSHNCWKKPWQVLLYLGINTTKPVFWVSDKARLKPVSWATETSWKIENLLVASLDMILSNRGITKALIKLYRCAGWSVPLLLANSENRFSRVEAHSTLYLQINYFVWTGMVHWEGRGGGGGLNQFYWPNLHPRFCCCKTTKLVYLAWMFPNLCNVSSQGNNQININKLWWNKEKGSQHTDCMGESFQDYSWNQDFEADFP